MGKYVVQRILLMIPTLFIVSVIVFGTVHLTPGDPAQQLAQSGSLPPDAVPAMRAQLGLDLPLHEQYFHWLNSTVLHADFGESFSRLGTRTPVSDLLRHGLPITLELGILSIAFGILIALPVGILSALKYDTWIDQVAKIFVILGLSVPSFWLATIVIVYPSIWWNYTPPLVYKSFAEEPVANLQQFLLPAFLLGLILSASTARLLRSMMLEVLRQDYIRTARAKGLRDRVVVFRHALRNAMIPVITQIAGQLGIIVGGSAIIETVFNLPGIGQLMVTSMGTKDFPTIQALALLISLFVVVVNFFVDLSYSIIDPRVRL